MHTQCSTTRTDSRFLYGRFSVALVLLLASHGSAQTFNWTNSENDNQFSNLSNWSGSPASLTGQNNAIWQIDLVGDNRAEVNSAIGDVNRDILLGVTPFGKGELFIGNGGSLRPTRDLSVGDSGGEGTLRIEGGALSVGRNMRLGRQGGGDGFGRVSVDGGSLSVVSSLFVGQSNRSQNEFTLMNDGSVDVGSTLNVAHQQESQGTLRIMGGTLSAGNGVFADGGQGPSTATLSISGNGSLVTTAGGMRFAAANGGATANVNLSGNGSLTSQTNLAFAFGDDSIATLDISGGSMNAINSFLTFGQGDGSQVLVNMTGGEINTDRLSWANSASSTAVLNMTGGIINVIATSDAGTRGAMSFGDGQGQLNLSGTAIIAAERLRMNAGGTLDLDGNSQLYLAGSTVSEAPTFDFSEQFLQGDWSGVNGRINFSSFESKLLVAGETDNWNPGSPLTVNYAELFNTAIANDVFTHDVAGGMFHVGFDGTNSFVRITAVPEPSQLAMLGTAGLIVALRIRRRENAGLTPSNGFLNDCDP
jgi:hypothetical protein